MSDIKDLFNKLTLIGKYNDLMHQLHGQVETTAFFPGGCGTIDNDCTLNSRTVMVLGQDFDSEKGLKNALNRKVEDIKKNKTWNNLLNFLNECGIDPKTCFFTNAIMGYRIGNKATGKSPAFKDEKFIDWCGDFFLEQIKAQKPKLILVLGKHTAEFLSPLSEQLKPWEKISNFNQVDERNQQIMKDITFKNNINTTLVLLVHPSYRQLYARRRKILGSKTDDPEVGMVKNVLASLK